jgi:hypothetical protein
MTRIRSLATVAAALFGTAPLAAQTTPAPAAAPAAAPATPLSPAEEARLLELGKTYTRWFLTGKADSLVGAFAPDMAEKVGGVEGVQQMMNQIAERAGVETKVTEEKMTRRNGRPQFWHAGQFSDLEDDELVIRWVFDQNGKIAGAGINPKANAPAPDAQ